MPTRIDLMPGTAHAAAPRRLGPPIPAPAPRSTRREFGRADVGLYPEEDLWEGPTLRELVERVEHQFGQTPALAGVFTLGFGRDEPLTPGDIRAVCEHLGLPATDFGLDLR